MSDRLTDEEMRVMWGWCITGIGPKDVHKLVLRMIFEIEDNRIADKMRRKSPDSEAEVQT